MARWRLMKAHYLNVPGTEWEYKEVSRTTGKQARKVFEVPLLLNPDDGSDCNYPGEIIVCHVGKGQGRDIEFIGKPTPDMEPLDAEAIAISDSFKDEWINPIDNLPNSTSDFTQSLLNSLERQIAEAHNMDAIPRSRVPNTGVSKSEFDEMKSMVNSLMKQNSELMAKLEPKAEKDLARRI